MSIQVTAPPGTADFVAGIGAGVQSRSITGGDPRLPKLMHNKVLICDDAVVTGSYNLSHSATENAENVVIIEDRELADRYGVYIDHLAERYREGP
jgi:phosphatidylserine/phosphatidylglycerophosphate/cardiolipin synthase-like enzyme